jgi:hypothetical protein
VPRMYRKLEVEYADGWLRNVHGGRFFLSRRLTLARGLRASAVSTAPVSACGMICCFMPLEFAPIVANFSAVDNGPEGGVHG